MASVVLLNNVSVTGPSTPLSIGVGVRKAAIQVSGSFSGEVMFEATLDGTTWFPYEGEVIGGGLVQCVHAPCVVAFKDAEAVSSIRVNVTKYSAGTITAVGYTQG